MTEHELKVEVPLGSAFGGFTPYPMETVERIMGYLERFLHTAPLPAIPVIAAVATGAVRQWWNSLVARGLAGSFSDDALPVRVEEVTTDGGGKVLINLYVDPVWLDSLFPEAYEEVKAFMDRILSAGKIHV